MQNQLTADATLEDKQQRVPQVFRPFGVTVRLAAQSGKVTTKPVVHAFDGARVRLAFEVLVFGEDVVVALVIVRGVSD